MRIPFLTALFIFGAAVSGSAQTASDVFWQNLQALCGRSFAGTVAVDTSNSPDFAGKKLVMQVRSCQKDRIRIPFHVGDDRSRTWILTRINGKIRLKHDHRHPDGRPDKVTMYGGTATNSGMETRQFFPADEETVQVVEPPKGDAPSAAANVWWIELVDQKHFTYNLRRMGLDRHFAVRFDLTKPLDVPPPPPWGWKD